MMQTNRALVSLTLVTSLLVVPDEISAQRSRLYASRRGTEALTISGEPHVTEYRLALIGSNTMDGDMLDSVRRQPRDLLNGIALGRAERKAVNGIVRKNGRQLRLLEAQRSDPSATPSMQRRVEREIAALRDRERVELRAVLSRGHQHQFDANLAHIGSSGL